MCLVSTPRGLLLDRLSWYCFGSGIGSGRVLSLGVRVSNYPTQPSPTNNKKQTNQARVCKIPSEMTSALISRSNQIEAIKVKRQDMNDISKVELKGSARLCTLRIIEGW